MCCFLAIVSNNVPFLNTIKTRLFLSLEWFQWSKELPFPCKSWFFNYFFNFESYLCFIFPFLAWMVYVEWWKWCIPFSWKIVINDFLWESFTKSWIGQFKIVVNNCSNDHHEKDKVSKGAFIVATLALGSWPRQGVVKLWAKWETREHSTCSWECKECEGMNPHTPKWTPMLGVGVPKGLLNL
jgi:hypothetical protein